VSAPLSDDEIQAALAEVKHDPGLMSAGRHGCWAACSCGWSSGTYGTTTGAHLAFGRHLVSAEHLRARALGLDPTHGKATT
jgi:hypothetical protein